MLNVIDRAGELWPKATDAEIGLVGKLFKDIPEDKAIEIMDDARMGSRYTSVPFPEMKKRVRQITGHSKINGFFFDCWAVNELTGKFKNQVVTAMDEFGARTEINKYLEQYGHHPVNFTLFIGEEAQIQMNTRRFKILQEIRP